MERTKLRAVEMVRRIRDKQAEKLVNAAPEEIIAFFRRAGQASQEMARARGRKKVR